MSHLLNASVVLNRPDGLHVVGMAISIAKDSARFAIQCDCVAYEDALGHWFDTTQTTFMGDTEQEAECRQWLQRSIDFIEAIGGLERHPHPKLKCLVRFVEGF